MISGVLNYKDKKYLFTIEDDMLYVDAIEPEGYTGLAALFQYRSNRLEEKYLVGECYRNGHTIIIFPRSPSYDIINDTIIMKIYFYIDYTFEPKSICGLSFSGDEIDCIYDRNKCIQSQTYEDNGEAMLKLKPTEDTTKNEGVYTFKGIDVNCIFRINSTMHYGIAVEPITLRSTLSLYFSCTEDFDYVLSLYYHVYKFFSILCYRTNVKFKKIVIMSKNEEDKNEKSGEMIIFSHRDEERPKTVVERYIPYVNIAGHVSRILQDIADEKIHTEHLPDSFRSGNAITPARFVIVTAAFDWEFRRLYPEGILRNEQRILAQNAAEHKVDNLIDQSHGKEKDIYKRLKNKSK